MSGGFEVWRWQIPRTQDYPNAEGLDAATLAEGKHAKQSHFAWTAWSGMRLAEKKL